jgi:Mn2+/Fe2+ NRAMP family transporter
VVVVKNLRSRNEAPRPLRRWLVWVGAAGLAVAAVALVMWTFGIRADLATWLVIVGVIAGVLVPWFFWAVRYFDQPKESRRWYKSVVAAPPYGLAYLVAAVLSGF